MGDAKMKEPPQGYRWGWRDLSLRGAMIAHLVKTEEWNFTALCGVQVESGSLMDIPVHGPFCRRCLKQHSAGQAEATA